MTVTVRPATHADVPAITRIYAHAVEHGTASFELDAPDQAEMTRRFKELNNNGFPYLVAVIDGAVVGYAYAGPYRSRPAYRFTVENSVYVAPRQSPPRRRQGTPAGPHRHLHRKRISLDGRGDWRFGPGSFDRPARGRGFKHAGTFENIGYKFERWLDSVLMQRALGPGASKPP